MRNEETDAPVKGHNERDYGSIETQHPGTSAKASSFEKGPKTVLGIAFISALPKLSKPETNLIPFYKLYKFATWTEIIAVVCGFFFGVLTGLCIPLATILYGEFTTLLIDRVVQRGASTPAFLLHWFGGGKVLINASPEENKDALLNDSAAFAIGCAFVSLLQFVLGVLTIDLFNFAALRQINRIRKLYFESILRQDMTWYDTHATTNFAGTITEDLDKIKNGIGEKVGIFLYLVSSFVSSIVISFIYGWELTLVMLSCAPVIIIATAVVAKIQSSLTAKELKSYGYAGTVAEEVFNSIKTVAAFGGEHKEIQRYSQRLEPSIKMGSRKGMYSGIGSSIMWFIMYATYALGFWYGVQLILEDRDKVNKEYTPAVLIIIFFGVLAGAQNMGLTSPHLEAFAAARGSAAAIFKVLDRKSPIDAFSPNGSKLKVMKGHIEFKDVYFQYPARPEVKVLHGLNLSIKAGERVAFVGGSGCGKSTIIQLVQRLYDPVRGTVCIDGENISKLNVQSLRGHIGVVGQEPVLFATSIASNIALGKSDVSQKEIEDAAKRANCHEFIKKMPNGYFTVIGERGSQLSGGQKQRIAIARALVRNPKILLLDEATSALDFDSEAKVQAALDEASYNCTTLIVSHRLSTIRNVDRIFFIKDGQVAEMGTHEELMQLKKMYFNLVEAELMPNVHEPKKKSNLKKQESINSEMSVSGGARSTSEISEEEAVEAEDEHHKITLWRIMKLNFSEWPYLLIGSLAAVLVGASFPAFAVLFGETYGILSGAETKEVMSQTEEYALWFVAVGVLTGIGAFLQCYMFNIAGVRLTTRVRILTFSSMLKQEMGWYDEAKNSVGALCARLASDAAGIQGATGTWVGAIFQASSTFLLGIFISLFFTWKLTLVSMVSMPLVLGAVFLEGRIMNGSGVEEKRAMESAAKVAVEAISNIRTVAGLGQERHFMDRYFVELKQVNKALGFKSRFRGIVFSFGQSAPFLGYALSLWYGGNMVAYGELEYKNVIKVSEALIFGAWMMGQALAFAPNLNAAKISAQRIFNLLDRVPRIISPPEIEEVANWKTDGDIKYSKVDFSYPTRPEICVLKQLELNVCTGSTVALVGGSGCGKSTCIQLLQRLYDPASGLVTLDNKNISSDLPISTLRAQLGIVSQEPVLFDKTIAENISYGDNARLVTRDEIVDAAKKANIHNFIASLPLGYETSLGVRGTQLSGGQKQRIAIARALIRDPRILLLDEATSALDSHSEKIVQAALEVAREGRTCVIIAHRLATVRNADVICVLDDGKVAERGTHQQLIAKGGLYNRLYNVNK